MLPLLIGIALGVLLIVVGRLTRFDRDTSFYPTVLIFIAGYYVLFAAMAQQALLIELAIALGFAAMAFAGYITSALWVGIGILLHGVFDLIHPHTIDNAGVPTWWPAFCAGVDIPVGLWVIWQSRPQRLANA